MRGFLALFLHFISKTIRASGRDKSLVSENNSRASLWPYLQSGFDGQRLLPGIKGKEDFGAKCDDCGHMQTIKASTAKLSGVGGAQSLRFGKHFRPRHGGFDQRAGKRKLVSA